MIDPNRIIEKAKHSGFYLWLLNIILRRVIPFNKPHNFQIIKVADRFIKIKLPFTKNNLNHINGLHACALATLTEFTSGLVLLSNLPPSKYRIILKRLEMDYHYQGKMDAFAEFELSEDFIKERIQDPLLNAPSIDIACEVKIHDKNKNHLSTGNVTWQIKDWSSVKTKKVKT